MLKKLKIESSCDPTIALLGTFPNALQGPTGRFISQVHSSIIPNGSKVAATPVSIHRGINEQNTVYTHNRILSGLKRKDILTHATTWANPEDTMLHEISQLRSEKYCMVLSWGPRSSQTHGRQKQKVVASGWGRGS